MCQLQAVVLVTIKQVFGAFLQVPVCCGTIGVLAPQVLMHACTRNLNEGGDRGAL